MSKQIYLPGLNGIRAIAASIVLIFHIDQFFEFFGIASLGYHKTGMAGYGVILFFVLSGFLISYLLLSEKEKYKKIDLPKFYVRRILRIWPIFYLVIIITLLIFFINPTLIYFPKGNECKTFILFSLLLSNVGYGMGLGITTITPLWSVGVEEQFYAFWPFLVNKSKNILRTFISVIVVYFVLKLFFRFIENGYIYDIISLSCFDCMAIGGIGAYLYFIKSKLLKIIYHPILQIIAWSILLVSIFYKPLHLFSIIDKEIHAVFYLIILNVSTNNKSLIKLENRFLDFIGKISYGMYVFHMIVLVSTSYFLTKIIKYQPTGSISDYLMIYLIVIIGTIGLASLSYYYFESYFLKLKGKYSRIESKNSAMS
jgi:peptidoglycan/LPS O-acetylase OafA/YrhL